MKTVFFDIETGPLHESELLAIMPEFDPNEVKVGNIKDPEKIAAKIAEVKEATRREFIERAALDPLTGVVLAIGLLDNETQSFGIIGGDNEADTIREFWATILECTHTPIMVGFNIHLFDLPFLIRRSWRHRIAVPAGVRKGRYWSEFMVDLRDSWQLGDRQAKGSLDAISKHLGIGSKNGDGKDFANLWHSDRSKAVEYIKNDLELTRKMFHIMHG